MCLAVYFGSCGVVCYSGDFTKIVCLTQIYVVPLCVQYRLRHWAEAYLAYWCSAFSCLDRAVFLVF